MSLKTKDSRSLKKEINKTWVNFLQLFQDQGKIK